jgi:hypothetical protein
MNARGLDETLEDWQVPYASCLHPFEVEYEYKIW